MKPYCTLIICLLLLLPLSSRAQALKLPAIQVTPLQDSATRRNYELYIKLPEGYHNKSDNKHPVIYIVDALWNMEMISGSIEYFVKDAILVGISWEKGISPQQSRMRDYTSNKYTGSDYKHPTGQADKHLTFLKHDVFTHVESKYKADPKRRTFYGFSAGGTFGAYILFTQPDTFKNYIIGSPASLFGGHHVHEYEPFAKQLPERIAANVFLSVGTGEQAEYIDHAFSMMRFLKSRKTQPARLEFQAVAAADHGQAFPLSLVQSLLWLANISKRNN